MAATGEGNIQFLSWVVVTYADSHVLLLNFTYMFYSAYKSSHRKLLWADWGSVGVGGCAEVRFATGENQAVSQLF